LKKGALRRARFSANDRALLTLELAKTRSKNGKKNRTNNGIQLKSTGIVETNFATAIFVDA
jgi:hypothetical protein